VIPRLKPALGHEELVAALRFSSSRDIEDFEASFAAKMDSRFAVAFPYGRTGLLLLLEVLGIREKEVIVPAYTCVVVPHAVVYSGNRPVFVDSQLSDFNMDLGRIPDVVTRNTGAIVATSIFGYPCDLDILDEIRERLNDRIPIIQDCAHCFGAEWKGRAVRKAGVAAVYGLNISKVITSIFGGMVTTDDERLYVSLRRLRDERVTLATWTKSFRRCLYLMAVYLAFTEWAYGAVITMERAGFLKRFTDYYDANCVDMPADYLAGITSLEARVGSANLQRYDDIVRRRRETAAFYFKNLQMEEFHLPPDVEGATYSHFVVRVPDRTRWLRQCLTKGLQLGQLIEYSIPELPAYGMNKPERFPVAAGFARTTINLPVWGDRKMAAEVARKIREVHLEVSRK